MLKRKLIAISERLRAAKYMTQSRYVRFLQPYWDAEELQLGQQW